MDVPILSLDIPSGLHPDTPNLTSCCIKADYTVTFAYPKKAFLSVSSLCGRLFLAYIGLLDEILHDELPITNQIRENIIIELEYINESN